MELTKAQEHNLVIAIKSYKIAKGHFEAAQRNMAAKLDKLKECCQGAGNEQQILATAYELLANAHINRSELEEYLQGQ